MRAGPRAGHHLLALGALGIAACSSAAPALTLGATAVLRGAAIAASEPPTVRAGAWLTWHGTTALDRTATSDAALAAPATRSLPTSASHAAASLEPPCATPTGLQLGTPRTRARPLARCTRGDPMTLARTLPHGIVLLLAVAHASAQSVAPASAAPHANTSAAIPAPTPARLRAVLARFRHEPSVAVVVSAARASMALSPITTMASRARMAGWVPTMGLSARRGQAVDLSSPSQSASGDPLRLSTDDELSLTASLTFQLDRLVFRREEIPIVREARAEREARGEHIRDVVRLYFLRRRLQLERALGVGDATAQALGIAEAEAVLDVFTNGAFGRMLRASRKRR